MWLNTHLHQLQFLFTLFECRISMLHSMHVWLEKENPSYVTHKLTYLCVSHAHMPVVHLDIFLPLSHSLTPSPITMSHFPHVILTNSHPLFSVHISLNNPPCSFTHLFFASFQCATLFFSLSSCNIVFTSLYFSFNLKPGAN